MTLEKIPLSILEAILEEFERAHLVELPPISALATEEGRLQYAAARAKAEMASAVKHAITARYRKGSSNGAVQYAGPAAGFTAAAATAG